MVFLIQNTQNRDSHAIHLKLDELLRALEAADTSLVDLEERSEQELERLHQHYLGLASSVASKLGASRIGVSAEDQSRSGAGRRNQSLRAGVEEPQT
jgi:low affinity Fe/Cu permease